MFLTVQDRSVLNDAKKLIEKVHNNINGEFEVEGTQLVKISE